jgi:hypothetical protein
MVRYEKLLGKPQCHPKIKGRGVDDNSQCIPDKVLEHAVKGGLAANKIKNSIPLAKKRMAVAGFTTQNNNSRNRKTLRKELAAKVGCDPNSERCIIDKLPIDQLTYKKLNGYLRPKMPNEWKNDPDQWLDNTNIEAVMKQYEESNKDFKFLGVHPIDFSAPNPYETSGQKRCLVPVMCNVSVPKLRKEGIRSVGVVFNLDPHTKSGSHWVSCFIDTHKCWVYYFDSYGMKPPAMIHRFMKSLLRDEPRMKLGYNARRFQFGGSECGMYSLYFIICMLEGADFKEFVHRAVPDNVMLKLRKWFFSH